MPSRRALIASSALALVLVLTGCSDDGGEDDGDGGGEGRPTTAEVEEVLPTAGLSPEQVECLANAFVDSQISDEGLRAIVDAGGVDKASGLSAEDASAVQTAASEAIRCSASDVDIPPVTG
jgi:PBP1b-binding outer membrane lipoprotein LpoB